MFFYFKYNYFLTTEEIGKGTLTVFTLKDKTPTKLIVRVFNVF